jgi:hypothetical protein
MTILISLLIRRAACAWCGGTGDWRGTGYCAGCGGTGQAR